jgi:pimeloyl-ACP methyl ester carboxylesterase
MTDRQSLNGPAGIQVRSGGTGPRPPLILLHGVTRAGRDLEPVIERLPAGQPWIAVDFRGHGQSARRSAYQVRDYVEDVGTVLEWSGAPRAVVYGHSLGAMVAAASAARWSERIVGAVLEDPPFSSMGAGIGQTVFAQQFQGLARLLAATRDPEELYQGLLVMPVTRPSDGATVTFEALRGADALRSYATYLTDVDPAVLAPIVAGRWLEGIDIHEIFSAISGPVWLFQGQPELGGMLTEADAAVAKAAARDLTLRSIEGAGHMLHWSHPELVAEDVARFLARLS